MAKQGLRKICILKDQFGLKLGGGTKREEKRKKRKRRWRSQDQGQKGMDAWILVWKLTLIMNPMRLSMKFHAIGWLLVIPKPRVC